VKQFPGVDPAPGSIGRGNMMVFGIVLVRDERDVIRLSIAHHLALGLDAVLVTDNGSTDGTAELLDRLSREDPRIQWQSVEGPFNQVEYRTELAREAVRQGADWILPFDADEFWWVRGGDLRAMLAGSAAGALRANAIDFIQHRGQLESTEAGLLRMTRRVARQIPNARRAIELGEVAYVEQRHSPRWLLRPTAEIEIGMGRHTFSGVAGPPEGGVGLAVLHAPLRSRACLEHKADHGERALATGSGPEFSWHLKRWARLRHAAGGLDQEWRANSYDGTTLDVYGAERPVIVDDRLRNIVTPHLSSPQEEAGDADETSRPTRSRRPYRRYRRGRRAPAAAAPDGGAAPDQPGVPRAESDRRVEFEEETRQEREAREDRSRGRRTGTTQRRTKITVIAWDVSHNPLGRAYLLADMLRADFDVALIGARFPRYGGRIWEPVRSSDLITRTFQGHDFPQHFHKMTKIADEVSTDVVYVSKPRLPSLELGILIKMRQNCPLLLDVDDHELSFFANQTPMTLEELRGYVTRPGFFRPYGNLWTRYCESIIQHADGLTTSNETLQARHGGVVIQHARDETRFDPTLYDRASIRAEYGFGPDDRVIMFLGTPQEHKGLLEVAQALTGLADPHYKLCIVGSFPNPDFRERLTALLDGQLTVIPNQPFLQLPRNLVAADLVCLLQDPGYLAAAYQMPAKFTDALAMGIPMIATDVPPLRRPAEQGLVKLVCAEGVGATLEAVFADYDQHKARAMQNREVFLAEYSYAANRPKLEQAIRALEANPAPLHPELAALIEFHEAVFAAPTTGGER
jgi:glycosyltransferase involved in cell wall biosynthesis